MYLCLYTSSEEDLKPAPSLNLLSVTQENAQEHERKDSEREEKKGATVFHPFFFSLVFFAARSMEVCLASFHVFLNGK